MDRKPIPKSVRFEVFKRDGFTCQYCGASSPDVILEVDHIKPVSKGGKNDLLNLITSCRDCNRGKSNRVLSDDSTLSKQRKQMQDLQERREQLKMMVEWREQLAEEENIEVDAVCSIFARETEFVPNENGRRDIKSLIRRFGFQEVYTSTEMSVGRYYSGSIRSWDVAFSKIGGICYNRKKARDGNA